MKPGFRPMLGVALDSLDEVCYPVIATPKLDGIRCITTDLPVKEPYQCLPVCRSLKQVPNAYIRSQMGLYLPPGLDGELITYGPRGWPIDPKTFHAVQSDVMSETGKPDFIFHAFDWMFETDPNMPYELRASALQELFEDQFPLYARAVVHKVCHTRGMLEDFENTCLELGYEGVCFRDPRSPYKYGRSTQKQQWLIKMKRFEVSEAVIIGMEESMANNNPQTLNELGYAERSSHKANMQGKGIMGALVVRDVHTKAEHRVGTGFSMQDRETFWKSKESFIGKGIQYKHQLHGRKDLPRIPSFVGMRDLRDMDPIEPQQKELL